MTHDPWIRTWLAASKSLGFEFLKELKHIIGNGWSNIPTRFVLCVCVFFFLLRRWGNSASSNKSVCWFVDALLASTTPKSVQWCHFSLRSSSSSKNIQWNDTDSLDFPARKLPVLVVVLMANSWTFWKTTFELAIAPKESRILEPISFRWWFPASFSKKMLIKMRIFTK